MVEILLTYQGDLRTHCVHGPSQTQVLTDAPVDNQGRGESFSPTDLLATALGSCMMTYLGMAANRNGWNLDGTTMVVQKEMVADPMRRVGRLPVHIKLPNGVTQAVADEVLRVIMSCPVKLSISEKIEVPITIRGMTEA